MNGRTEEADAWGRRLGVVAGVTDRGTGSLGLSLPEPADVVLARWRALRDSLKPRFHAVQIAHQVHGAVVARHENVAEGFHVRDDTDGHVTAQRGLLLAVTIADCAPVYLARDDASAVALLHCGWRGTAAGMIEAGIRALSLPDCPPARLSVFVGLSICKNCYEVGPEVPLAVDGVTVAGKGCFDLRTSLARRAREAGVGDVTISELCTSCDNDRFFSHRRNADGNRQVAYLGIAS